MTLGEKIQKLRKQRGLSQEALAEKVTVTRQTISKWELGQSTPDLDFIAQLSDIFNVSSDYLIKDEMIEPDELLYKKRSYHLSERGKLPEDIANRQVFVVDPMLATGGSAVAAIDFLKKHGCRNIIMMNIIGAPEGVKAVQEAHPDVEIYLAALDEKLNEHAYIVPGLGDAGDRIFGTK